MHGPTYHLFLEHFLVTEDPPNRAERAPTDRQNERCIVGVGRIFLGRTATALATRLLLGRLGHRLEVGVVDQVGTDSIPPGHPSNGLASRTALDLHGVDACGAVRDRCAAAPHRCLRNYQVCNSARAGKQNALRACRQLQRRYRDRHG
ncbi:hypothetical protein D3C84_917950 [compost metagenome]